MAFLTVTPRPMPAGIVWTRTPAASTPTPVDVVCLTPTETAGPSPLTVAQAGGWLSSMGSRLPGQEMRERDMRRYARTRPVPAEKDAAPVDEVVIAVEEELPEPAVPEDLRAHLDRLVPRQPGRGPLLGLWLMLGGSLIERCALAGVTTWAGAANKYERPERRLRVYASGNQREALAILAQACDHALGGEEFASKTAMAVLAMCPGQAPEEFFSRSLAGHVSGERGPLSAYLDYLLTRGSQAVPAVAV